MIIQSFQFASAAPLNLSSPHNGTTLTVNTSLEAHLTFNCTSTPPMSHHWWFNGEPVRAKESSDSNGNWTITAEGSLVADFGSAQNVVGIYQCIAEHSVVSLRVLPKGLCIQLYANLVVHLVCVCFVCVSVQLQSVRLILHFAGLTNPPGIPLLREILKPCKEGHAAYLVTWTPPSYPPSAHNYSLKIIDSFTPPPPVLTHHLSEEICIIAYIHLTIIVEVVNGGVAMSEASDVFFFANSTCYTYGKMSTA